jgi:HEAT repeat protein
LRAKDALFEKSINDRDWAVRDAAIKSLGKIINIVDEKEEIIKIIIPYIEDKSGWVSRSAMSLLSEIKDLDPIQIPFEKVINHLNNFDPKVRQGVAKLLSIYDNNIEKLFDYALVLLGDDNKEVRANMIDSIVKVIQKVGLKELISRLLQNLSDEASLRIQQSISLILERTVRYEDEKLKKRALSLLKIRCEVSQDPIICEVFNKLNEI